MDSTTVNKVFSAVDALEDEMLDNIMRLVNIPSITGQEARAQEFMAGLYEDLGLKTEKVYPNLEEIKDHPAFIATGESYENRFNVVGTLPGDENKKSLVINGHIDVVAPDPVESWETDPFEAVIKDDKIYGRGAGDMKSGLLANYFALKALINADLKPEGTVILQSVIDEEPGGAGGTLYLLKKGYTGDGLLISEPHNLRLSHSHAGILYFRINVLGKSAHGGLAHQGVNAIGKIIPFYNALVQLQKQRDKEVYFELYQRGSGASCHLSVSKLQAGDWEGKVAGHASMSCRISFVPGEKKQDIKKTITKTVADVAAQDDWFKNFPPEIQWFGWQCEPYYQDTNHPFVKLLDKTASIVLGKQVEYCGRSSGNDGRFGPDFGIPSAVFGPIAPNIHGPNEYVEVPSIAKVAKNQALFMYNWCKQGLPSNP